jgi:cytochrome c oxidase assembly protein subunit 15
MLSSPVVRDRHAVLTWLAMCLLLVALMVLVGGYTRLSGSGLSITKWKPIHGVIPPLNDSEWQEEFSSYQNTPQYKLINSDISLAGFKDIFWPEYIHRLLGRAIGIIFFLPLLVFTIRKSITKIFFWKMVAILALGGLQGGIGWIMVKSGLQDSPYVNHSKLALHLSIAFIIFALILWNFLDIIYDTKNKCAAKTGAKLIKPLFKLWIFLLFIQIIFGGFMAGLHAGFVYNTWPTMNGEFLPNELLNASLFNINILGNIAFIQFIHRTLAVLLAIFYLLWCYSNRKYITENSLGRGCVFLSLVIFLQFTLGVVTLIFNVPLLIALTHQIVALFLWAVAIWLLYRLSNYINRTKYIELVK